MDALNDLQNLSGDEPDEEIRAAINRAEEQIAAFRSGLLENEPEDAAPDVTKDEVSLGEFASEYDGTPAEAAEAYRNLPES